MKCHNQSAFDLLSAYGNHILSSRKRIKKRVRQQVFDGVELLLMKAVAGIQALKLSGLWLEQPQKYIARRFWVARTETDSEWNARQDEKERKGESCIA